MTTVVVVVVVVLVMMMVAQPAPFIMMHFAVGDVPSRTHLSYTARSERTISKLSAFNFLGRFSVTVPTDPSMEDKTVLSAASDLSMAGRKAGKMEGQ